MTPTTRAPARPGSPPEPPESPPPPAAGARACRGLTLLELVLALASCAILFTAVGAMVFATVREDRYLQACHAGSAEVELAMRRIAYNIRTAQPGSIVLGANTLTTVTAADSTNGYPSGATVIYSLANDTSNAGQKVLIENDPRYGATNVLAHNVSTFSFTNNITNFSGVTDLYQIDLVLLGPPIVERHFQVYGRN
jgi:hypothetical protein